MSAAPQPRGAPGPASSPQKVRRRLLCSGFRCEGCPLAQPGPPRRTLVLSGVVSAALHPALPELLGQLAPAWVWAWDEETRRTPRSCSGWAGRNLSSLV